MTGNVELTGRITIPAAEQAEMVPLFEEHARLSRAEPGCLRFEIACEACDAEVFSVSELFVDEAAFEAHGERTRASEWGRRSAHLVREFKRSILE
jgi:quinol monooxygenase YgiN